MQSEEAVGLKSHTPLLIYIQRTTHSFVYSRNTFEKDLLDAMYLRHKMSLRSKI